MAVFNPKKLKYTILRGSFGHDGINEYLRDLSYGRGTTFPVKGAVIPTVRTAAAWDGQDGQLDVEEDIDEEIEEEDSQTEKNGDAHYEYKQHRKELQKLLQTLFANHDL